MLITLALLRKISPAGAKYTDNMNSIINAVNGYGAKIGLDQPHRQAHFLAQVAHESGDFRYDREIASGAAYEGRKDLGNVKKGDGKKFKGRTEMQLTGRANYRAFTVWVRKLIPDAPDFEKEPDLVNTDPYEGLAAMFYWETHGLNRYADQNDIEMITKRVNGGLHGFDDRKSKYVRAALALLGESLAGSQKTYVLAFQKEAGFTGRALDGDPGPRTRAELHKRLVKMTEKPERSPDVQAAPVVEKQAVPIKLASLEGNTATSSEAITAYGGAASVGATVLSSFAGLDWKIVAILAATGVLGGLGFLVYKRWSMKQEQASKIEAIEARQL